MKSVLSIVPTSHQGRSHLDFNVSDEKKMCLRFVKLNIDNRKQMQFARFEKYDNESRDLRGGAEIYSQIQRRRISNPI